MEGAVEDSKFNQMLPSHCLAFISERGLEIRRTSSFVRDMNRFFIPKVK